VTRLCRLIALAIAVAAAIDPQFSRPVPAALRVGIRLATAMPSPPAERWIADLVDRLPVGTVVARELATPDASWCVGLDACVAVADGLVAIGGRPERPVHVVRVAPPEEPVVIAGLTAPGLALEMRDARLDLAGGRAGETLEIVLDDRGVEVGRVSHRRSAAPVDQVSVPWWPRDDRTGRLDVRIGTAAAAIHAETSEVALEVLVWEMRPSWTGTFVRRALEADRRLVVRAASQVAPAHVARRGITGAPGDADLERARAVVVTGVGALAPEQAARLERHARGGGSLVVALDEPPTGAAAQLMPGPVTARRRALEPVGLGHGLRAAESIDFAAAEGDAVLAARDGAPPGHGAVVVERRTGRGRIVVSGALDAWRWRDGASFDSFWRDLVVRAARASSPPLGVTWTPGLGAARLLISSRAAVAAGRWPSVTVVHDCGLGAEPVPAVAGTVPGTWVAALRAPAPGCVVRAASGDLIAEATAVASPTLPPVAPWPAALEALAAVSGGTIESAGDGPGAVAARLAATPRPLVPAPWHPMRVWGWLVPFVAALAGEWWLRRRAGLP
jgi:hypothetical protein